MSADAITPLGGGESGVGSLAERWQQVAAAVAQPAEGAGQPGEASASTGTQEGAGATGSQAVADAAHRLPTTGPGTAVSPSALLSGLPPAPAMAQAGQAVVAAGLAQATAGWPGPASAALAAPSAPSPGRPATPAAEPTTASGGLAAPATAAALAQPSASHGAGARSAVATADTVQVPVTLSPLFTTPSPLPRRPALPTRLHPPVRRVHPLGDDAPAGQDAAADEDHPQETDAADPAALAATGASAQEADAPVLGAPAAPPDLAAWRARLQQAGHQPLLRELELRRYILLVCPQPAVAGEPSRRATAWLLGGPQHAVLALPARWVAPAPLGLPAQWRLHRTTGGALDGLRSRPPAPGTAGTAPVIGCRIGFGDVPALPDPAHAHLSLAQPRRFLRGLAGQWSLLLLVEPEGLAA
ncbi:hypothetical protein MW290_00835 [Aquincola tertiaricarbonis]|uniref:Uncharacterized protein n=1 Tax=Aquincola tertiaricarbonis TaxID=391953 RepID=A0ABY4S2I1_AQUTE|nr:hypothetical protein [Aquincola tertiaricarbonis]URI07204.1 hypothetical protein MW290_00835 [Aquincola tertiaricarbonis]